MKHISPVLRVLSIVALSALAFSLLSCSERTTNITRTNIKAGVQAHQQHVFYSELLLQLNNQFQLMPIEIYLPYTHSSGTPSGPIPLLVLLPPQGGDQLYYFDHGLEQVANELISDGTIQPMAIACLSSAPFLGGILMGGNSPAAGNYDALLGDSLISYFNFIYPGFFSPLASKRGIGGFGIGSYGAIRSAILHPDLYSSVSVIDGPLDFDGATGNGGLIPIFGQALNEQGLMGSTNYLNAFDSGDGFGDWRASKLLLGGAIAFSPHDTSATAFTRVIDRAPAGPDPNDDILVDSVCTETINDLGTLINGVFTQTYRTCGGGAINFGGMHLPFTRGGNVYAPIWNTFWLPNSPDRLLQANQDALDNTKLWFGTSTQSEFTYYQMTQSLISTLKGAPYSLTNNITEFQYTGTPELPAKNNEYTYDLLKEILIFHDKNFNQ
jgi:hypothetical protein